MSRKEAELETSKKRWMAAAVLSILLASTFIVYSMTDGFTNNPLEGGLDGGGGIDGNETDTIQQGVKVTGTGIYANDTPISSQTIYGLDSDNDVVYIAAITNGAFTSNRGPAQGGTYDWYVSISGCILWVGEFTVPSAADYNQESVNMGTVKVFTSSSTYTAQMIGATTNTYDSGTGTAGTTNYTQSANIAESYTLRITNTEDYSQLYREYTDPRDDIPVEPVLWIQVAATTAYTNTAGVQGWDDTSYQYFIMPLSAVVCEGTTNVALTWDISIVIPTAGTYEFDVYIVDGSDMSRLLEAESKVADPNTGETVTSTQIVDAYVVVS